MITIDGLHLSRDGRTNIRGDIERLQKFIENYLDGTLSFFDFIDNHAGKKIAQKFSVKNEKFKISIPLIILISLIKRLIVFKLAIMYKFLKNNMLEVKVRSEKNRCQHIYLTANDNTFNINDSKESLCLVQKSQIAFS